MSDISDCRQWSQSSFSSMFNSGGRMEKSYGSQLCCLFSSSCLVLLALFYTYPSAHQAVVERQSNEAESCLLDEVGIQDTYLMRFSGNTGRHWLPKAIRGALITKRERENISKEQHTKNSRLLLLQKYTSGNSSCCHCSLPQGTSIRLQWDSTPWRGDSIMCRCTWTSLDDKCKENRAAWASA